ncbi:MAG: carboxypeptidase regulatory-like domain-containing protein, partial [Myxococcota bacterium]
DQNTQIQQRLWFTWKPLDLVSLVFSQAITSNSNSAFEPRTVQSSGDPTFSLKVAHLITSRLGLGVGARLLVPTSPGGQGLKPDAFVLRSYGAATLQATRWLGLSLNAGYTLDRSAKIFKRDLLAVQRFAAGINSVDQITGGFAAETEVSVGDRALVGPFVEVSAAIGSGASSKESPILATAGVKLHPFGPDRLAITVGGDWAVQGTPTAQSTRMAGVSPWTVFGSFSANLAATGSSSGPAIASCTSDASCQEGQKCVDGMCAIVREVVKTVTEKVVEAAPTFRMQGTVLDAQSKEPVHNATIKIGGYDASALAADFDKGSWISWMLPAGDGLVQVSASAPGYRPAEQTVPRGAANEVKSVDFALQSSSEEAKGQIRGSIKDSRTGRAVKAQILIPSLGQKVKLEEDGTFNAEVKAGRYQVLISARGYVTQKKEIEIRAGDVVILNVDLLGRR